MKSFSMFAELLLGKSSTNFSKLLRKKFWEKKIFFFLWEKFFGKI